MPDFTPPPLSSHEGPSSDFIPPPLDSHEDGITAKLQTFGQEHPYVSAALSSVPGVGPIVTAFTDPQGDIAKGNIKQGAHDLYSLLEGAGPIGMLAHAIAERTGMGDKIRVATEPSNPLQRAGAAQTSVAEMALPLPKAAGMAESVIPTAEKAGAKFASVMESAHDMPINVAAPGDVALKTRDLALQGGAMPKVIRDFISRATDPNRGPITYEEARGFYSNATRLSADEAQRLTPVMRRQVGMFTQALNDSISEAAAHVGKLEEYHQAMSQYHNAMRIRDLWDEIKSLATSTAVKATGAGAAGAYALKKMLEP